MSKLREKSEFNIDAAEYLFKKSLYAPSVHCSYYSCFQLLKYTIKIFFDIDYDVQTSNITSSKQSSHKYVINYVCGKLESFVSFEESRKFRHKIKDLKQFRIESDYENIEVSSDKGDIALRKAKEIRTYLITNFNV